MCFSSTASFTAAAVLIPIGIYSLKKMPYFPIKWLALAPFFFGIQQFFEGIIWVGFNINNSEMINITSYLYLFFAYSVWPFYIPFCVYQLEKKSHKKNIFKMFVIMGGLLSIFLSITLFGFPEVLRIQLVGHSIQYGTYLSDNGYSFYLLQLYYILVCFLPCFISSNKRIFFMGWLILISAIITIVFYNYAYASVWCFFAALISLLIPVLFIKNKSTL